MPTHILVNSLGLTHKGTIGMSAATIPDVCKTPSPGGPVPIPYPNFADQSSLQNGTTTVSAKGEMIAIKGSQYGRSNGDEAGTAGGVKSNVNMQATDWITYSFDVKMDGQNACRHTDLKFHNNQNTVDLNGNNDPAAGGGDETLECGKSGTYGDLKKKTGGGEYHRDHIPSKKALKQRAEDILGRKLKPHEATAIENGAFAVAIPAAAHRNESPTYGGRNKNVFQSDADDLQGAAKRDVQAMQEHLDSSDDGCGEAYKEATEDIPEMTNKDYDKWLCQTVKNAKL